MERVKKAKKIVLFHSKGDKPSPKAMPSIPY